MFHFAEADPFLLSGTAGIVFTCWVLRCAVFVVLSSSLSSAPLVVAVGLRHSPSRPTYAGFSLPPS